MRFYHHLIFYVPMLYAIRTRRPHFKDIIRFVLTYFVPIFLFLIWRNYSIQFLLLGFIFVYDLYEIGYIENDCETIKKEKKPTLRLSKNDLDYYNHNRYVIYVTKIVIAFVTSFYLVWSGSIVAFILVPWFLIPTYLLYNRMRSRWNLPIHVILMLIRYYAPVLIATQLFICPDLIAFLFVYPFRVMIELSVKGKFGGYKNIIVEKYILHDYSCFKQFRIKYYTIALFIVSALFLLHVVNESILVIYAYFFLFTLFVIKIVK